MTEVSRPASVNGVLDHHVGMVSRFVQPRNVDVWLPPGYQSRGQCRFPAIYMHDGQNLFEPGNAFGGVHWGVGETLARLARCGEVREAIVIGIWNTGECFPEYMPQKPLDWPKKAALSPPASVHCTSAQVDGNGSETWKTLRSAHWQLTS